MAYQGLSDEPEKEAFAVRQFFQDGHEFLVAYSCSKNFGLYGERVGALLIACEKGSRDNISSDIRQRIRATYSSPARHGIDIVNHILKEPDLKRMWLDELKGRREKLKNNRAILYEAFQKLGLEVPHILKSRGLFCLLPISKEKVISLRKEKGIYLSENGRINIAALKEDCFERLVEAIL
jgi:aspartate/tyrosine/aromatic aminotransferase